MRDRWDDDVFRMDFQMAVDVTNPKRRFRHVKSPVMFESVVKT